MGVILPLQVFRACAAVPLNTTGDQYTYKYYVKDTMLCLDIPGQDLSGGNKLWIWDCSASSEFTAMNYAYGRFMDEPAGVWAANDGYQNEYCVDAGASEQGE